jgi:hypothetical protein
MTLDQIVKQAKAAMEKCREFLTAEFESSIDAQRIAWRFLGNRLCFEVPVDHARGEIDEVLDSPPGNIEGIFEGAKTVIVGVIRILVGPAGVRNRREQDDNLRLDLIH